MTATIPAAAGARAKRRCRCCISGKSAAPSADEAIAHVLAGAAAPADEPPDDGLRTFANALVRDTVRSRSTEIDRAASPSTPQNWRLERMAVIDRLILRMAVCELLAEPETPPRVVINEALELARTFSTEEAVKFINGMLDAVKEGRQA